MTALLEVDKVTVSFDGFRALNELTLALEAGELRCIVGPNGAGKTTLMDIITGKTRPDTGTVRFGGRDITRLAEHEIVRLGIGRKFQTPSVYVDHTVLENLLLSLKGSRGVFAAIFNRTTPAQRDRIADLLKLIRLESKRDLLAGRLAHGEKQWLEIGMLLAQDPELLLVDEPAAGMTDEETHRTGELLISLAGRHSLIVVEHDMTFVRQIAQDRKITVLHQGSVLCEGRFEEVQGNPKVREVYLGRGKLSK